MDAGAKAAIEKFAQSLAKELGDRRMTVNVVSPGVTDTEGLVAPPKMVEALVGQTPLGRLGSPKDIAQATVCIAGEVASYRANDCAACHSGRSDWPLGFSTVQLARSGPGVRMSVLAASGRLTSVPSEPLSVPGHAATRRVLGYLHANCGHCHRGDTTVDYRTGLRMWLNVEQLSAVEETDAFRRLANEPAISVHSVHDYRIEGMVPAGSELIRRLQVRDETQMPPLGTEIPDTTAIDALSAWIATLPVPE